METVFHAFERRYGKYIPENLTYYLLVGQILAYVLSHVNPQYRTLFPLLGRLVYTGEWWRLFLFIFTPSTENVFWTVFTWYLFYLFGAGLEQRWGAFRYLIYILIAYLGIVVCAFLFPDQIIGSGYVFISVFLAFAYLYPDVQLLLFFIIPVKVKWLGILTWIGIVSIVLFGSLSSKILTAFSVGNFFLFFGKDVLLSLRIKKPAGITITPRENEGVKNICAVCGKYERDHRDLDFRYCTDCEPPTCYCPDHLENHVHQK